MNRQGIQMAIDAIYRVINSAPSPYATNYYSNNADCDILPQQFDNWENYLNNILDISYQNLGLDIFFTAKYRISQLIQQFYQYNMSNSDKLLYLNLVDQIKNELFTFIQYLSQY